MDSVLSQIPLIQYLAQNQILIFIILVIFILGSIIVSILSKRQKFPYQLKQNYLTPAELSFFSVLKNAVQDKYEIVPQVPLKSIMNVKPSVRDFYRYFNKIDRKVVDFVLFEKIIYKPVLIIELDDSSHNNLDRKDRDYFIDKVAETVKLPILHIPVKSYYNVGDLIDKINSICHINHS